MLPPSQLSLYGSSPLSASPLSASPLVRRPTASPPPSPSPLGMEYADDPPESEGLAEQSEPAPRTFRSSQSRQNRHSHHDLRSASQAERGKRVRPATGNEATIPQLLEMRRLLKEHLASSEIEVVVIVEAIDPYSSNSFQVRHVRPCVAICGHVRPCATMCGHVWPCVAMCGHVRSCATMCGHVWPASKADSDLPLLHAAMRGANLIHSLGVSSRRVTRTRRTTLCSTNPLSSACVHRSHGCLSTRSTSVCWDVQGPLLPRSLVLPYGRNMAETFG